MPNNEVNYEVITFTDYFGVIPATGQLYLKVSQLGLAQDSYEVSHLFFFKVIKKNQFLSERKLTDFVSFGNFD